MSSTQYCCTVAVLVFSASFNYLQTLSNGCFKASLHIMKVLISLRFLLEISYSGKSV